MTTQPRKWCDPPEAFGQLTVKGNAVTRRVWLPPTTTDPVVVAEFGAAVMQNAICVHVRSFKNSMPDKDKPGTTGVTQNKFASLDNRPHSADKWQKRLTGQRILTMPDVLMIVEHLPGALPSDDEIRVFLDVAYKRISPPPGWRWPDT